MQSIWNKMLFAQMIFGSVSNLSTPYYTRLTVPVPFDFEERNQRTAEKKKRLQEERLSQDTKVYIHEILRWI